MISHMLLKHRGFHAAYEWARGHRNHASAGAADLAAARRSFKRAEHVLPPRLGLNDCLPRSLALYAFLAGAGIGVTHRIGVKRYPFGAHAWVEHEAKPVVASEASVAPFKIIASL